MEQELEPCPFCGNDGSGRIEDALHVSMSERGWREPSWSVQCDKCTATTGYFDTKAEATAAWNTRATPSADDAFLSKAVAVLTSGIGETVMFLPENDDATYKQEQTGIDCNGEWTDWVDRRFLAETHTQAVKAALEARHGALKGTSHETI